MTPVLSSAPPRLAGGGSGRAACAGSERVKARAGQDDMPRPFAPNANSGTTGQVRGAGVPPGALAVKMYIRKRDIR